MPRKFRSYIRKNNERWMQAKAVTQQPSRVDSSASSDDSAAAITSLKALKERVESMKLLQNGVVRYMHD